MLPIKLKAVRLKQGLIAMPRENDLEGVQDQGGKHGGQKGMPKPESKPPHEPDQGIVRDEKGQEQPRDKARAQQVSRTDTGPTMRFRAAAPFKRFSEAGLQDLMP
jgi:hypothetical protein